MLWTLLIVIANNLPEETSEKSTHRRKTTQQPPNPQSIRIIRAKTAGEMMSFNLDEAKNSSVTDFIGVVRTMATIFPDPHTRIVLKSVLQDYDIKEVR